MAWSEHLFQYCERGHSTLFWAEPLNAISNTAFLVAGGASFALLAARARRTREACAIALTVLLFAIAIGSFMFHTVATRAAELGDQLPILAFVLVYLGFALRRLLGLSRAVTTVGVGAFAVIDYLAGLVECPPAGQSTPGGVGDTACLWGSFAYLPALVALGSTALVLRGRGHWAARSLLAASSVFAASLLTRTLDMPLCGLIDASGGTFGTHFVWHMLNALTLFILVKTAIRMGDAAGAATSAAGSLGTLALEPQTRKDCS